MKKPLHLILSALLAASAAVASPERLVTLGGAATEIVFELGAGSEVVGVDQSSRYPEQVRELPNVGYVRAISAEGVLALEPTLVVATSDLGPPNAVAQLQATGVRLLTVDAPDSPESLYNAVTLIGETLSRRETAERLNTHLRERFAARTEIVEPPRVVFLMQTPGVGELTAAGRQTKADAVIALAGGRNVVQSHLGYRALSAEALLMLDPEVILVGQVEGMPRPEPQLNGPLWEHLTAVAEGRVHTVPLGRTLGFGVRAAEAILALNQLFSEVAPQP